MNRYIALFFTQYAVIKFHSHCEKNSVKSKTAPVPRKLSASCGICVRFEALTWEIVADAEDLEGCYECRGGEKSETYALVYKT